MDKAEILRLDRRHVWHPCTQEKDHEAAPPIPIARGEGVFLFDVDGNRYIDGVSSWWVNIFGHNHPRLNAALSQQASRVAHHIFAGFTHEPAVELASRLAALAPGDLSKVFFTDNGSAAVEAALKMSFQYWQQVGRPNKTRFVSISEAYHGETVGALSVGGCDLYRDIYRPILLEGYQVAGPDCFRCPYGLHRDSCQAECFAAMEQLVERERERIAGVIIEPLIQGAAGMRIYPPVYLRKLRQLCDRCQVHYIADEIAVAFGRTGRMFANEHAGVAPDMMCLSKGITGGYMPLAVVLTTEEIYQAFYDDYETMKTFFHSHSYSGNPLGCALAVEVLRIFEQERILEGLAPRMALLDEYAPRFEALEHVGEFRRCGMVAAVEMVENKAGKIAYPWQQRRGYRVYQRALKKGALLRPLGNVIYFMPPLTIPVATLRELLEIALQTIAEETQKLA
ncbi:adenosylmethionine-8-amino-7-oxononanoate aminotransferase [Desulfuromonas versatilis]|uniref:Adenosylmethionine-8-amino-7-oxononanoate aminotransferase n=1 Tax=Desulfuromonas versatilis TaxID=2802975 RepID=A0ABM8HRW3_9BACT|nr:adenosylmethionine--8-amino-7-oxononanoate transaminase [Desulfuromonas versatilis]BCR05026.1 adenosylmethionine-8-amino-7-oxononanoate aminotransferase [Desulfuromonas versatilis]